MKKILLLIVPTLLLLANPDILIEKRSHHSFDQTVQRFIKAVHKRGLKIFCRIDHSRNAAKIHAKLPPATLFLFGSPKLGTTLMRQDPRSGLSLPLKVLIYQRGKKTYLLYRDPLEMAKIYHLSKRKLYKIAHTLRAILKESTR